MRRCTGYSGDVGSRGVWRLVSLVPSLKSARNGPDVLEMCRKCAWDPGNVPKMYRLHANEHQMANFSKMVPISFVLTSFAHATNRTSLWPGHCVCTGFLCHSGNLYILIIDHCLTFGYWLNANPLLNVCLPKISGGGTNWQGNADAVLMWAY